MDRVELLENYCKESPNDPFNWYALALEYARINIDRSLALHEKISMDFPSYIPNYYHLAQRYQQLGQTEQAKKCYEKGLVVIEKNKEARAWLELSNAYQNFLFENDLL
ncbi:MAG: tetratricopeptide repeat protein [Thermonemataceae bacterium]|nr:tetratricopeptide repeat protein [Thermonemataceae bacterium]